MTPEEKKEMRRASSRRYYWKKHKRMDKPAPNYAYMEYKYKVVPNTWRAGIRTRDTYVRQEIDSPLVKDLLAGKTLFVDYQMPLERGNNPFRTLYNYFATRGFKLRVHVYDDVKSNKYRRILMWAEPIKPMPYKVDETAA
jgi:hypothetical protein